MCHHRQFPTTLALALLASALSGATPTIAQDHVVVTKDSVVDLHKAPITLALSNVGHFRAAKASWHLSVNSAGRAELTIDTIPHSSREFDVSELQLNELRQLLAAQEFFELSGEYGELVPDGSCQSLTISAGQLTKTVQLRFLANYRSQGEWEKLREPARALRVWLAIRGWFDDPQAVDLTRYHRMTLDALAEAE